jgi:hypothetical protein
MREYTNGVFVSHWNGNNFGVEIQIDTTWGYGVALNPDATIIAYDNEYDANPFQRTRVAFRSGNTFTNTVKITSDISFNPASFAFNSDGSALFIGADGGTYRYTIWYTT